MKIDNLGEVCKGVLGFLWIEVVDISDTVLDTITDHIILEHVVHKVKLYMIDGLQSSRNTHQCIWGLVVLVYHCSLLVPLLAKYTSNSSRGTLCY